MKERPILFNGAMVRAVLDGSKTQTRRTMKPQPQPTSADYPGPKGHRWPSNAVQSMVHVEQELQNKSGGWGGLAATCCPYGKIGDRLWVRETWSSDFSRHYPCDRIWYRADDDRKNDIETRDGIRGIWSPEHQEFVPFKWRPSIHMFRAASRITLEITGVRVERLQDITDDQALAEGVLTDDQRPMEHLSETRHLCERCLGTGLYTYHSMAGARPDTDCTLCDTPRKRFANLWNSINGAGAWDANPWDWVVEFRRVAP